MNDCSSSSSSILEDLLHRSAAHLHCRSTGGDVKRDETTADTNALSLEQLVPVHQSLLEASGAVSSSNASGGGDGDDNDEAMEVEHSASEGSKPNASWWEAFFAGKKNNNVNNDNGNSKCGIDNKDWTLCQRILGIRNNGSHDTDNDIDDCQKLLVWQYLLQKAQGSPPLTTSSSSLPASMEWLSAVLFEYILPLQQQQNHPSNISGELATIVLDLSLGWVAQDEPKTKDGDFRQWEAHWSQLRSRLLSATKDVLTTTNNNNNNNKLESMPLSSRIVKTIVFRRLARNSKSGNNNTTPFFLSMLYEHLWRNLEYCCVCGGSGGDGAPKFLSDLSKTMLLPLLKEFQSSDENDDDSNGITSQGAAHYHELQNLLRTQLVPLLERNGVPLGNSVMDDDNDDDENDDGVGRRQHLLLVATTVLCPLVPRYLKQTKQQQQQQQQQHHQEQSWLWKFIYVCLQQGRRSIVKGRECDQPSGRGGNETSGGNLSFATGAGGLASMLRRRALYLLDVLVTQQQQQQSTTIWKDYILCVETFEMENERHIIEQIWPVVAKLVQEANKNSSRKIQKASLSSTPPMTLAWIELLVGRILSAEQLAVRKLGIFRLLQVLGKPTTKASLRQSVLASDSEAATSMDALPTPDGSTQMSDDNNHNAKKRESSKQPPKHTKKTKKARDGASASSKQKKKNKRKGGGTLEVLSTEMLLTSLSPKTFLWDVLVPSWDSLGGSSVGYTIHLDNPKTGNQPTGAPVEKFAKIDMVPLFCQTIRNYTLLAAACGESSRSSPLPFDAPSLFWKGLWDWDRLVRHLSAKTLISVYRSVSELLVEAKPDEGTTADATIGGDSVVKVVPMDDDDLGTIRDTFVREFRDSYMVLSHRRQFLNILSWMISKARLPPCDASEAKAKKKNWSPINVLSLLTLFLPSYFPALESEDITDWSIESEEMLVRAGAFVHQFESQASSKDHAITVGAALASAFVTGHVSLPPVASTSKPSPGWNPVDGSPPNDREMAWAVSLFCTLAVSETIRHTSGELLWPAIHKGLSQSAGVILSKGHHPKADFVARALLLLENGCKLRQLSGLGNGDLVVNPKTQQIMPPPPNIEQMLQNAIDFVQWHVRMLLSTECHKQDNPEESQKGKRFTGSYALLISQLKILHQSYPSSQAVSTVMNELLQKSTRDLKELLAGKDASTSEGDVKKLLLVSLIYGACSCGAEPEKKSYTSLIRLLMSTGLSTAGDGQPGVWVKSSRSIIQYARWATILCLLPKLLDVTSDSASDRTQDEMDRLIDDLLKEGVRASSMTPSDAIKPLFDCIVMSSREWMGSSSKYYSTQMDTLCVTNLTKIVQSLLSLIKQSVRSRESAIMLNGFCALVFQPKLLREEFDRITKDPKCKTPIRDGFRQLIKMAGRYRQQITRAVLCRITVGWLDEEGSDSRGLSAIPYREDIVKLLIFKEGKYDESSSNQSLEELPTTGVTEIPSNTNYHSVTRTFLLVFFGQLPNPQAGLNTTVKKELLHYVILELLKHASPEKTTHPSLVMRGTPTYCIKIRAWQALCILSRFVTQEIASNVCATVYGAMNELLHNQIRFFLENFTIKCATMHEMIFGEAFLKDICRTDLSLQHISSLMIMGGNFIVGRYQLGYFTKDDTDKSRSKRVLAGVVPWLSSTQGFSRAIAQLIVYKLIPRVVSIHSDNTNPTTTSIPENDWFLKSTYNFLEQNREMNRLRNKQTKFFERYDCDAMCTPEGIFSIKIDEAEEADPLHLIDVMKEALRSTYDEAHAADAPSWKHVEERMIDAVEDDEEDRDESNNITSTVQRKIIPLDSLNLALEDLREQRLSNARGAHKQNLIVCASLVDKVPNLAGLARTCEIFAAQSLVIPDLSVSKMDNFQSISVGAVDWIDMEEVKEEALLPWLLQKKTEGFWIVGLEQTSSSVPLHQIEIPDFVATNNKTVLLLGKEKEGIPIQFLQAVDKCVEIPQFGMIRSLNVHVSGAITIWELTRKTRLAVLEEQRKSQEETKTSCH